MSMFNKPQREESDAPKELIPEGMHTGRLYGIIDLGTHKDSYQGVESEKHKIRLIWELEPKMADGKPFAIGKDYTITRGKWGPYIAKTSALFDLLKTWVKWDEKKIKLGNLGQLIGQEALVTISHEKGKADPSKTYAKLGPVLPLMKGMKAEDLVNEPIIYELGGDNLDKLPQWLQDKIGKCLEWNGGVSAPKMADGITTNADDDPNFPPF